ncbi:hypothetical protein WCD74_24530 [Actinomycetospora sp. OC33-EN08]|uniref:DUF222 domain-containing protein n=1 Tax=Actinomycetospora aurantiaca TaxID=3129233 RepID=A0ABU8MWF5_9PSEU
MTTEHTEFVDLMARRHATAHVADDTPWPAAEDASGERGFLIAESELGEARVEGGGLVWEPPATLDAATRDYVTASVAELNRKLADGRLEVDDQGVIRTPRMLRSLLVRTEED